MTVFFHNYYGKAISWINRLDSGLHLPFNLMLNKVNGSYYHSGREEELLFSFRNLKSLKKFASPNQGKDIGGKLVMMDAYLRLKEKTPYLLFIHDKKSPYHAISESWSDELLQLAENASFEKAKKFFESDSGVGMVTGKNAIRNEVQNDQKRSDYIDSEMICKLKDEYRIQPKSSEFSAGTMFYVRSSIFEDFFTEFLPLSIRATLEKGNISDHERGTVTHAWERLFSWIVTTKNFSIKHI